MYLPIGSVGVAGEEPIARMVAQAQPGSGDSAQCGALQLHFINYNFRKIERITSYASIAGRGRCEPGLRRVR